MSDFYFINQTYTQTTYLVITSLAGLALAMVATWFVINLSSKHKTLYQYIFLVFCGLFYVTLFFSFVRLPR